MSDVAQLVPAKGLGGAAGRGKDRALEILAGFSSGQKAMTAIALLAVVVGGYLFTSWASKPSYTPLFSNLNATDAAAITQKLTSEKIPYQLADGGTTVLVPVADVYQQRLDMSAAGLPTSASSGYTLLDKAGITSSDFQQQVEYQQAVQTELDNTIEAMSGISAAVVHVVIPQQSLFTDTSNQPSASVLVELQPGVTLGADQVQAIVHLVASSIENLDPNNVTVVDNSGHVLSAPGSDASQLAEGDAQSQETAQYDEMLNTEIENFLAPVLGAGNAVVDAAATLNYSTTSSQATTYAPKGTPVSVSTTKENYKGASATAAAGGTVGTTTGTGTGTSSVPNTYTNTSTNTSTVVGQTVTNTQLAPGAVQHLSVAVILNSAVKNVNAAQIKALVTQAAGLVPARGDTLQVSSLPFSTASSTTASAALKAAAGASSSAGMMGEIETGALLLLVIVLLVLALRKLSKPTRIPIELPEGLSLDAAGGDGGLALAAPPAALALEAAGGPPALQAKSMGELIDSDPAKVAELLRSWLAEDAAS